MKLSLCQIKPNRDWKISLDIAQKALEQAAAQGAELALLPELFPIPYEFSLVERCAQPIDGPIGGACRPGPKSTACGWWGAPSPFRKRESATTPARCIPPTESWPPSIKKSTSSM